MAKFCARCGVELKPEAVFCPKCGKAIVATENPKRQLTDDVIRKALPAKGASWADYTLPIFFIFSAFGIIYFGGILGVLIGIAIIVFFSYQLYKCIKGDYYKKKGVFTVEERICTRTEIDEYEDTEANLITTYYCYFEDEKGPESIKVSVEHGLYLEIKPGEACYLVTAESDDSPCLCYRKKDWIR